MQAMLIVPARAVYVGKICKTFFRTKTVVGVSAFHQFFCIIQIFVFAFALDIRSVISAHVRTFVPQNTRIAQRPVNNFHCAFYVSALIGIFYTQYKLSVILFCVQVRIQRATQSAYV